TSPHRHESLATPVGNFHTLTFPQCEEKRKKCPIARKLTSSTPRSVQEQLHSLNQLLLGINKPFTLQLTLRKGRDPSTRTSSCPAFWSFTTTAQRLDRDWRMREL